MSTDWIIIAALVALAGVVFLLFRSVGPDGVDGTGIEPRPGRARRKNGTAGP